MTRPVGKGVVLMDETALTDGTTNGTGFTLPPKKFDEVSVNIEITNGNADVQVQGRVSEGAVWTDLLDAVQDELKAAAAYSVAYFPIMRARVTNAATTPDVRVEIYVG